MVDRLLCSKSSLFPCSWWPIKHLFAKRLFFLIFLWIALLPFEVLNSYPLSLVQGDIHTSFCCAVFGISCLCRFPVCLKFNLISPFNLPLVSSILRSARKALEGRGIFFFRTNVRHNLRKLEITTPSYRIVFRDKLFLLQLIKRQLHVLFHVLLGYLGPKVR